MSATSETKWTNGLALSLAALAIGLVGFKHIQGVSAAKLQLLNVSYDPTRELYAELIPSSLTNTRKTAATRSQWNNLMEARPDRLDPLRVPKRRMS